MGLENSRYSPADLERIADDKGPYFDGMARQALRWAASVLEAADAAVNAELGPLPDPVDELCMVDGFNVLGVQQVFTADQMRAYARAAVEHRRRPNLDDIAARDLLEELASLGKDAERYRALRDSNNQIHEDDPCVSDASFRTYFDTDLDAAADKLVLRHRARNPPNPADLLPNAEGKRATPEKD